MASGSAGGLPIRICITTWKFFSCMRRQQRQPTLSCVQLGAWLPGTHTPTARYSVPPQGPARFPPCPLHSHPRAPPTTRGVGPAGAPAHPHPPRG